MPFDPKDLLNGVSDEMKDEEAIRFLKDHGACDANCSIIATLASNIARYVYHQGTTDVNEVMKSIGSDATVLSVHQILALQLAASALFKIYTDQYDQKQREALLYGVIEGQMISADLLDSVVRGLISKVNEPGVTKLGEGEYMYVATKDVKRE
jgi:hypothetical protein